MNNVSIAEKAEAYGMGFLSARTLMLLEKYKINMPSTSQDRETLVRATDLIDDILQGYEILVDKEGSIVPDIRKFRLFNYFFNDLKIFDFLKIIVEPENGNMFRDIFKGIKLTLKNISQGKQLEDVNFNKTKDFFQVLSELLLRKVQEYYRPF